MNVAREFYQLGQAHCRNGWTFEAANAHKEKRLKGITVAQLIAEIEQQGRIRLVKMEDCVPL